MTNSQQEDQLIRHLLDCAENLLSKYEKHRKETRVDSEYIIRQANRYLEDAKSYLLLSKDWKLGIDVFRCNLKIARNLGWTEDMEKCRESIKFYEENFHREYYYEECRRQTQSAVLYLLEGDKSAAIRCIEDVVEFNEKYECGFNMAVPNALFSLAKHQEKP